MGLGNACDYDDDNDGVVDSLDNCPLAPNPGQQDFNQDGRGDRCEDSDGDGILDYLELPQALPKGGGAPVAPDGWMFPALLAAASTLILVGLAGLAGYRIRRTKRP